MSIYYNNMGLCTLPTHFTMKLAYLLWSIQTIIHSLCLVGLLIVYVGTSVRHNPHTIVAFVLRF